MEYYSQYGQDIVIKQFYDRKNIKNGIFLDVGSLDGIRFSNTLLLEEDGWTGICVEAHPSYFELLKSNRKNSICVSCAAGNEDKDDASISLNYRGSLTTLDLGLESHFKSKYSQWYGNREEKEIQNFLNGTHQVKMRKLDTIILESGFQDINLVSIDIDGSEKFAFQGLDLTKYKSCSLLVLENSVVGNEFVNKYAEKNGFIYSKTIGEDNFYVKTEEDSILLKSIPINGKPKNLKHPLES